METKVKSNSNILNKAAGNNKTTPVTEAPKVNNLPVSTAFNDKKEEPKAEIKTETVKAGAVKPHATAEPAKQPEPSKAELKDQLAQHKPALNLEETLKLVAELAKKTSLRDRYKANIENLQKFLQEQIEEVDELEDETAFQQCELIITHAKGGYRFTTKSPSVIKGTVNFLNGRFAERMAEVEAEIVLPA